MNLAPICQAEYRRPNGNALLCTYLKDHPTPHHSWYTVQCQDEVDAAKPDPTPAEVQAILDAISRGDLDTYLEALLAVGHNRKRARHGVAGFRRQP